MLTVTSDSPGLEVAIQTNEPASADARVFRIEGESRQVDSRIVAVTPFALVVETSDVFQLSLSSEEGDFHVETGGSRNGAGRRFGFGRQLCVNQVDMCWMHFADRWTAAR